MEDDDESPPLAIPIDAASSESSRMPENPPGISAESPVGVTVITGYLGAGKSTLVNYILSAEHGKKIAVILNEFGEEIGVERAMINEGEGGALVEEWVELANGCVCCTVKHSLVQALEQLVQRKERLDHILLETTGLADPAPLASVLWLDDQLESAVRLDSIITVVDAKNLHLLLKENQESASFPEAYVQIAFADVVILNKVDLVSDGCGSKNLDVLEGLEKMIYNINSLAIITRSVRCQVDLNKILDHKAYGAKHLAHIETLLEESKSLSARICHDNIVRTLCFYEEQPVDVAKVRLWFEDLLWEKKSNMDIYRCKGVLYVHDSDELHTLQAVREIYEISPARKWHQTEKKMNKIVFIGKAQNWDSHIFDVIRSYDISLHDLDLVIYTVTPKLRYAGITVKRASVSLPRLLRSSSGPSPSGTETRWISPVPVLFFLDMAARTRLWLNSVLTNVRVKPWSTKQWESSMRGITWP